MAGPYPALPDTEDKPVGLYPDTNKLRTRVWIEGFTTLPTTRPVGYGLANEDGRNGGNPLRQNVNGLWCVALPFARSFVATGGGAVRSSQPLTAGQVVNFPWNALTLNIPNPSPYTWEGSLNIAASFYTFGDNVQPTFSFYVYRGTGTTIAGHYGHSDGVTPSHKIRLNDSSVSRDFILPTVLVTVAPKTTGSITMHSNFQANVAGTPTEMNGIRASIMFAGNVQ